MSSFSLLSSSSQPPSPESIGAREQAEFMVRRARDAVDAEQDPVKVPLRLAHLAWFLYQSVFSADEREALECLSAAIANGESALRMAKSGSLAAFESRIILAHILIGRLAFVRGSDSADHDRLAISRAMSLAEEASSECRAQALGRDPVLRMSELLAVCHQAQYELFGDPNGLQAAIELISGLHESLEFQGDHKKRRHLAGTLMQLRYGRFELAGAKEDLDEIIRSGMREFFVTDKSTVLSEPDPTLWLDPTHVSSLVTLTPDLRGLLVTLSNAFASRSEVLRQATLRIGNSEMCLPAVQDAKAAVTLARIFKDMPSVGSGPALAENALGFALRALAHATSNKSALEEAVTCFFNGMRRTSVTSALGRLLANSLATTLAEMAHIYQDEVHPVSQVIDESIAFLHGILLGSNKRLLELGFEYVGILFNFSHLVLLHRTRTGNCSFANEAVDAAQACLSMLPPGHPRRAHVLSILALQLCWPESMKRFRDCASQALTVAYEAQAISESGAASSEWIPDCVPAAEQQWLHCGGIQASLTPFKVASVRTLIGTSPEPALELSLARSNDALRVGDALTAADYVEIACNARDRAMIVADDPVAATNFAGLHSIYAAAARVSTTLVVSDPVRAMFLLERSQGSAIARLQNCLISTTYNGSSIPIQIRQFQEAREHLRRVLNDRKRGALVATPESLHRANEAVEEAILQIQSLPGMKDFLVAASSPNALTKLVRGCLYIACGDRSGVAIFIDQINELRVLELPALNILSVKQQSERYLEHLSLLERKGEPLIPVFQVILEETKEFLHSSAWSPIMNVFGCHEFTVIPCGILSTLPWGSVTSEHAIKYSPSGQIQARIPKGPCALPILLVSDPRHTGAADLAASDQMETWLRILANGSMTVLRGKEATSKRVLEEASLHSIIIFYAHGTTEPSNHLSGGILLHDTERLDIRTILANSDAFFGRNIILACCSQGFSNPEIPSEMLSPATAFLAAGAAAVVAPAWPVEATSAQIIAITYIEGILRGLGPRSALIAAQQRLLGSLSPKSGKVQLAGLRRGKSKERLDVALEVDFQKPFFSSAFCLYG